MLVRHGSLLLLAWLLLVGIAHAEPPVVYVRNQEVGPAVVRDRTFYAPMQAVGRAAHVDLRVDANGAVRLNGRVLAVRAVRDGDRWLVPLQGIAQALGLKYRYDPALGIVDLYRSNTVRVDPRSGAVIQEASRCRVVNEGHGGEPIDVAKLLVPARINIVEYFAEDDFSSRRLTASLTMLADRRDDVVIHRVDVNRPGVGGIDWESPLMKESGLRSLPHFQVYDGSGRLEAEGRAALDEVMDMIRAVAPR